jgi:predicted nucleic acid-binding protein
MCVIVDINVAHQVFCVDNDPEFGTVHQRLFGSRRPMLTIAYGGRLSEEYLQNREVARLVRVLDGTARAIQIPSEKIDAEKAFLAQKSGKSRLASNDQHIVALARASGARVLLSNDTALWDDFRRKDLVDKPRGHIYRHNQDHLLSKCAKC